MEQSLGFVDYNAPTYVFKLTKALYGLKESPWAWFNKLNTYLQQLEFISSQSDSSMFIQCSRVVMVILLVYEDDIIITYNTFSLVHSLIMNINTQFVLKDLSSLSYFLGLKVQPTSLGVHLHQSKYV